MNEAERQQLVIDLTLLSKTVRETISTACGNDLLELKATSQRVNRSLMDLLNAAVDPVSRN